MKYFICSDGHYYAFDGDDSAMHLNVDRCLINILTKDEFTTVIMRYGMSEIPEADFMFYYKVIIDSFNELIFNVTAN